MSLNDRLAAFFRAHPHEWLDGRTLSEVAGCYAWRSRVSDCRRDYGMTITNQTRKVGRWIVSEYRYEPPMDPDCPTCCGHDLNVPWSLR